MGMHVQIYHVSIYHNNNIIILKLFFLILNLKIFKVRVKLDMLYTSLVLVVSTNLWIPWAQQLMPNSCNTVARWGSAYFWSQHSGGRSEQISMSSKPAWSTNKFQTSQSYTVRSCSKTKQRKQKQQNTYTSRQCAAHVSVGLKLSGQPDSLSHPWTKTIWEGVSTTCGRLRTVWSI